MAQSQPLHNDDKNGNNEKLAKAKMKEIDIPETSMFVKVKEVQMKLYLRMNETEQKNDMDINILRGSCVFPIPCILCGVYDSYFQNMLLSLHCRADIQALERRVNTFCQKSLQYSYSPDIANGDRRTISMNQCLNLIHYSGVLSKN
ncbi:hypothetical protein RFI_30609 [Reticulomyxa filosa]|uniref:Uncharacterized protein n=1 Tax=Reticulomyxa filosa TaxID=46433 RepID=X6LYT0_RETFI|nr:hypothetical protein RFI_30609 [Reticulomyxa filosa]|eukprot:ETO06784.1 hypothetical protein RFI_30609 [Reticulomyxa filosa]